MSRFGFIFTPKINPPERIYFWIQNEKCFFIAEYPNDRLLVQNLHTTNLQEKNQKKSNRLVVSSGISPRSGERFFKQNRFNDPYSKASMKAMEMLSEQDKQGLDSSKPLL